MSIQISDSDPEIKKVAINSDKKDFLVKNLLVGENTFFINELAKDEKENHKILSFKVLFDD